MATVAELETRLNEQAAELETLRQQYSDLKDEHEMLQEAFDDETRTASTSPRRESNVVYDFDENGKITDHDGDLAPTVDSENRLVNDPN
jgi:septal ring factor EnvC (AmiA/AmiB activator)